MGQTQSSGTATSPATPEVGTKSSNVEVAAANIDADLLLLAVSAERGTFKEDKPVAPEAKAAFDKIDEGKCANVFAHKFF
uniref:50S ribosomal protein L1 n=1 Tax=Panagrellus redivivus TaxID=6233 RepID=A0A7E4VLV7_PANRE